jgi:hypothetical protein
MGGQAICARRARFHFAAAVVPQRRGDVMEELFMRVGSNLVDRITGPLHFRMFLQPAMAVILATIDGWKDAKSGKAPYFWSLLTDPVNRAEMAHAGWKSVGKVFILALLLDAIYQYIVQKFVYAGELIIVAVVLAILPYLFLRGLVTRVVSPMLPRAASGRPID